VEEAEKQTMRKKNKQKLKKTERWKNGVMRTIHHDNAELFIVCLISQNGRRRCQLPSTAQQSLVPFVPLQIFECLYPWQTQAFLPRLG
jgi:hypothetical protein